MSMLSVESLAKSFGEAPVFRNVSLQLERGEFVALLGESGVGKSTLLNCIAGLETPDQGEVVIAGTALGALDDDGRARLRRARLGFVFQAFHVLPHLSVAENVALPLMLLGRHEPDHVQAVLASVGLAGRERHRPAELSGGERQRVAIARALVTRPACVLAD